MKNNFYDRVLDQLGYKSNIRRYRFDNDITDTELKSLKYNCDIATRIIYQFRECCDFYIGKFGSRTQILTIYPLDFNEERNNLDINEVKDLNESTKDYFKILDKGFDYFCYDTFALLRHDEIKITHFINLGDADRFEIFTEYKIDLQLKYAVILRVFDDNKISNLLKLQIGYFQSMEFSLKSEEYIGKIDINLHNINMAENGYPLRRDYFWKFYAL